MQRLAWQSTLGACMPPALTHARACTTRPLHAPRSKDILDPSVPFALRLQGILISERGCMHAMRRVCAHAVPRTPMRCHAPSCRGLRP